jgi:putative flippase GtrA
MTLFSTIKSWIHQHHLSKQIARFLVVGTCSTIISYSTFITCLHFFHLHYLLANVAGFILSIGFSYNCNKRWTFGSHDSNYFQRYFLFYLTSLILSTLLLRSIVELLGIIPEIANILTIAIITCLNFIGVKFLVFKK